MKYILNQEEYEEYMSLKEEFKDIKKEEEEKDFDLASLLLSKSTTMRVVHSTNIYNPFYGERMVEIRLAMDALPDYAKDIVQQRTYS